MMCSRHVTGPIEVLTQKLAGFKPTKIMVGSPYGDRSVQRTYASYLGGTYVLKHNETEQIGFRLAKKLGLPRIHPIDFPLRMSGMRPRRGKRRLAPQGCSHASPSRGSHAYRTIQRRRQAAEGFDHDRDVLRMNDPAKLEAEHSASSYLELLLPEDSAAIYARFGYFVSWYKRNVRMFANIARLNEFPRTTCSSPPGADTSRSCATWRATRTISAWSSRTPFPRPPPSSGSSGEDRGSSAPSAPVVALFPTPRQAPV